MIEGFRTHPFTRAVCLETARLFEQQAAKDLVGVDAGLMTALQARPSDFRRKPGPRSSAPVRGTFGRKMLRTSYRRMKGRNCPQHPE